MNAASVKAVEDFAGNLINVYANHFGKGNFSTDPWYDDCSDYPTRMQSRIPPGLVASVEPFWLMQ